MQILDNLCEIKDTLIPVDRLQDLIQPFSIFLRKMKLNFGNADGVAQHAAGVEPLRGRGRSWLCATQMPGFAKPAMMPHGAAQTRPAVTNDRRYFLGAVRSIGRRHYTIPWPREVLTSPECYYNELVPS